MVEHEIPTGRRVDLTIGIRVDFGEEKGFIAG